MSDYRNYEAAEAHEHGSRQRDIIFVVLIVLSIVGIGIMDFSARYGFWYWLAMVPLFAIASIGLAWQLQKRSHDTRPLLVRRQLLHWSVLVLGILLTFLMLDQGTIDRTGAGFVALLGLTLTTLQAGVHFEWRLAIMGLILAATLAASVLVETFFWALLIPTLIMAVILLRRRQSGHGQAAGD